MKKVKIMLMSLLVLAVVGGALAFKVKFSGDICTSAADDNLCRFQNRTCPNFIARVTFEEGSLNCTTKARSGAQPGFECQTTNTVTAAFLRCTTTKIDEPERDM